MFSLVTQPNDRKARKHRKNIGDAKSEQRERPAPEIEEVFVENGVIYYGSIFRNNISKVR